MVRWDHIPEATLSLNYRLLFLNTFSATKEFFILRNLRYAICVIPSPNRPIRQFLALGLQWNDSF